MTQPRPFFTAPSPAAQKLELLRELFPAAVQTDEHGHVSVSAAAIQQALDPANPAGVRVEEDGYELRWAGKREAYHSAFVPTSKIVQPRPEDSERWNDTGNLLIKGDNLDALRLLRQSYFGAVKLIYIDPPYNTQSDAFIYRDDFSARQTEILQALGYKAESVEYIKNIYGARTHSGWLSFMYPRLLLARDLLRDDGVIFISIDDHEQAQLKLLCDEVFGQENFIAQFIWQHRKSSQNDADVSLSHNYKLVYAKQRQDFRLNAIDADTAKFQNPDSDSNGPWVADPMDAPNLRENLNYPITNPKTGQVYFPPRGRHWRFSQEKYGEALVAGRIVFGKTGESRPQYKRYLHEAMAKGVNPFTIWNEWGTATEATKELMGHFDGRKIFDTPKPVSLLKEIIKLGANQEDLVLDFFAGSGTTGEAVMRLNAEDGGQRRFILVQIPQPIDAKKQKDAHHFVTQTLGKPEATIFEITAERLRRAGAKIKADAANAHAAAVDTGFRVFELADDPDALVLHQPLADAAQADLLRFQELLAPATQGLEAKVLYNLLLAEGLPLTARLAPLLDGAAWRADDVLFILQAVDTEALRALVEDAQAAGAPIRALSVYAPWVHDDNFLLGLKTLLEVLHLSEDKLRLRG